MTLPIIEYQIRITMPEIRIITQNFAKESIYIPIRPGILVTRWTKVVDFRDTHMLHFLWKK